MNNIKNKILIILGLIVLFIVSAIITVVILNPKKGSELSIKNENILHYSEEEQNEEDNVLVVGIVDNIKENNDTPEEDNSKKNVDAPYYIKINNQANVVTVYKKSSNGEYNTPVRAMLCSIGKATPKSGVYTTSDKYRWAFLQGNVYGQYAFRITGNILFHSVPYTAKNNGALEWWEFDKLGTAASLGCVRLQVQDAKWIYENCISGTKVEFYSSSNPGPLGKPTARKISDDEEVRGWDPTDPDKNNPWKDYLKKKEEQEIINNKIPTPTPTQEEHNNINIEENNNTNITQNENINQTLETNTNTSNNTTPSIGANELNQN